MSVQMCEGIWRNRAGQRVLVTQCEPVDGQRWTNGVDHYSDDGSFWGEGRESPHDLVSFVGPLPDSSQRAPVSRPAETESTTAVAGGVSDDPGRIIYEVEEKLKTANATIIGQTAEIDRLKGEWTAEIARLQTDWKTEFTAAQQLRSENEWLKEEIERLKAELRGYAAESHRQLRTLQESHEKLSDRLLAEHRGAQQAYLAAIKTFLEASR